MFLEALKHGRPVTVHGDGTQQRDLLFVDDAVAAAVAMASSDLQGTWNVGTGVATSIGELLAEMETVVAKATSIVHTPRRAGDVAVSWLAVDRIREDLGWSARYSLREGIRQTVEPT